MSDADIDHQVGGKFQSASDSSSCTTWEFAFAFALLME